MEIGVLLTAAEWRDPVIRENMWITNINVRKRGFFLSAYTVWYCICVSNSGRRGSALLVLEKRRHRHTLAQKVVRVYGKFAGKRRFSDWIRILLDFPRCNYRLEHKSRTFTTSLLSSFSPLHEAYKSPVLFSTYNFLYRCFFPSTHRIACHHHFCCPTFTPSTRSLPHCELNIGNMSEHQNVRN